MAETRYTLEGELRASGLGAKCDAFQRLLFNICTSGCTLPKIQVVPAGMLSTLILYTVEGTEDEIAIFRREASK